MYGNIFDGSPNDAATITTTGPNAFFPAQITAVNTVGGTNWYEWSEVVADPSAGTYSTFTDGRAGTYNGTTGNNPTQELNNQSVANGSIVWLRVRGADIGGTADLWYEFLAPATGGGGGSGDRYANLVNAINSVSTSGTLTGKALNVVTATSANLTEALPASPATGEWVGVQIDPSSTKLVTITSTVNGVANKVLWAGEAFDAVWDGSEWRLLNYVMKPMSAYVWCNSGPTIANAVVTAVPFNQALFSHPAALSAIGSNGIDIVRPGLYQISAGIRYGSVPGNAPACQLEINSSVSTNVCLFELSLLSGSGGGPAGTVPHVNTTATIGTPELITAAVFQNSGSPITLPVTSVAFSPFLSVTEIPNGNAGW